ncbi:MAG: acetyl-CoA decarbonylase/synthase complex subunit alpha/beta [Candidatus Aureabacteria bacterium]|nr:acetyl-CoA decarbonylase/synthase complex subunit alpha/beta [Candidatus Auribacterota bacterium]
MKDISVILKGADAGARKIVEISGEMLRAALEKRGDRHPVAFPGTAYYLPLSYAFLGLKVRELAQLEEVLAACRSLVGEPRDRVPTLDEALAAGRAAVMAAEAIEAVRLLDGPPPSGIWLGATSDAVLRSQGVKLVDGSMPGIAAIVGGAPSQEIAVNLVRDLQERNILVVMAGDTNGVSLAEQLEGAKVQMNWDTFLVPYGKELTAAAYALGFAVRAAMTFGGITPTEADRGEKILAYNRERVHAFVIALGPLDELKIAVAAGVLNFGFPILSDSDIPELLSFGPEKKDLIVANVAHDKMAEKAIEVRGIKIRITKIPIPVRYGPAFEGERVRKEDMAIQFGGKYSAGFEYLFSAPLSEVRDGVIELIGPDLDAVEEGGVLPLGIVVNVAGRKMQKDFEAILERHIHHFLSEAMGVMHIGQRDVVWLRISKEARKAGFRMKHIGEILRAKLVNDFPSIVDKVQVTIYTELQGVQEWMPRARETYRERDRRIRDLVDEAVEMYYSCQLCQSYAPNHVCIITPERLGLCGAYNWLDGKAAFEINPTGANQPVRKGEVIDAAKGKWKGINDFVFERSNRAISSFSAYSIMDDPMTSCGCFECVIAILPDANGFMIVNREYTGQTPSGMTFSSLAESVGGGQQTPGFLGIGTRYILSKKFISAEGGLKRIVWMTKEIKEKLGEELKSRCEEIGERDLLEKIADETVTIDPGELLQFLKKVKHPALEMEPLL